MVDELLNTLASELIRAANIADTKSPFKPAGRRRATKTEVKKKELRLK